MSYAQKTNINIRKKVKDISTNSNFVTDSHQINPQANITNLEQTITKLVDKIDSILNIITVIINKIK